MAELDLIKIELCPYVSCSSPELIFMKILISFSQISLDQKDAVTFKLI